MPSEERVTKVVDGNTFETEAGTVPRRVARLFIPEPQGSGGRIAHRALKSLIERQIATIEPLFLERDGALVATVEFDGQWVADLVNEDLATLVETIEARW